MLADNPGVPLLDCWVCCDFALLRLVIYSVGFVVLAEGRRLVIYSVGFVVRAEGRRLVIYSVGFVVRAEGRHLVIYSVGFVVRAEGRFQWGGRGECDLEVDTCLRSRS